MNGFPLFPAQASTIAPEVDHLYYFLIAVSVFFSVLIAGLIVYFSVKYRRRSDSDVPPLVKSPMSLEVVWTVIPLMLTMVMFAWGAKIFFKDFRPPKDALEVFGVGKQWMWKFQHQEGRSEINELHVPTGRAVKVTLGSEDVIHSFFVPAFRVKMDVVPGRYTHAWFQATKPGKYHLFCTQYCGTNHSRMVGWVYVMEPHDYERWLEGQSGPGTASGGPSATGAAATGSGDTPAAKGAALFNSLGCVTCHQPHANGTAPQLAGAYGKPVKLEDGRTVTVDDNYVRESILDPKAKVVAGFVPVMPSFRGRVSEDDLMNLLAYIKSLSKNKISGSNR